MTQTMGRDLHLNEALTIAFCVFGRQKRHATLTSQECLGLAAHDNIPQLGMETPAGPWHPHKAARV